MTLAIEWSPDGTWIVTTAPDGATVRDANTGTSLVRLVGHGNRLSPIAWSGDSSMLLTKRGNSAVVWETATGTVRTTLDGRAARGILSAAWSPDQGRVLTGSADGTARIWDPRTGAELACLAARGSLSVQAAWSPDGARIAMTGDDDTVLIRSADQPADLIATAGRVVSRELTDDERLRFGLPIPVRPPR